MADAHERPEVLDGDGALVGDDRQRGAFLEPAQLVEPVGRKRLLDQLDPESNQLRHQAGGRLRLPAGVRIDADGTAEHRPNGLECGEVPGHRA